MQPTTYRSSNSSANEKGADLILTGGRIYTGDAANPHAEAVAIRDGRFIAVGSNAAAQAHGDAGTLTRDLGGAFAMPGLYDMHTHPDLALGPRYAGYLDVGIGEPTPEQLRDTILGYAADHPDEPWVFGQHFVHFTFRQAGINPDRHWLDRFIPDRPVAIMDRMWGSVLVNSKGLEAAGVTAATPDPGNGYIVRD
ncbi:MAG TPA: amidohydrolase family protein, partial [Myxococcota bacterium]